MKCFCYKEIITLKRESNFSKLTNFKNNLVFFTVFGLTLFNLSFGQSPVFNFGSTWKYHDGGTIPATNWTQNTYSDNTWSSGTGEFGYGDGDESTVVSYGSDPNNKHVTTYFRKKISLTSPVNIYAKVRYDDGVVIYINGNEVGRYGMPGGTILYSTLANAVNENTVQSFTINSSATIVGENTLAVEVHQAAVSSSDLTFDFQVDFVENSPSGVYISEVMSSNSAAVEDTEGNYSDWVEIYNNSGASVNLANYYISDKLNNPLKYQLPSVGSSLVIPNGGRKLLWASGNAAAGPDHLSFSFSADGEGVILTKPDAVTLVDSFSFPKLLVDISYGRHPQIIDSLVFFSPSSPGLPNELNDSYKGYLLEPLASHPSGFYNSAFNLTLSSQVSGANIIYSLDGSDPSSSRLSTQYFQYKNQYPVNQGDPIGSTLSMSYKSNTYTSPLSVQNITNNANKYCNVSTTYFTPDYIPNSSYKIEKAVVVRFRAEKSGYIPSRTVSNTYFVNARNFQLPVSSVVVSPEKYWDLEYGFGVPGNDYLEWRSINGTWGASYGEFNYKKNEPRNGNILLFDSNKNEILNIDSEVKISGGYSRHYPSKSLRFNFQGGDIEKDLFENGNTETYSGFLLRNGG